MRAARALMIVAYGLFAIAAQTLLFREFVTAFEGNDISVGVFFGSWFLWVGLGAVLIRRWDRFAEALLRHVELLFLLYVPAFVIQLLLIVGVRDLAGVASYDLLSVQTIVLWAMVVNAPVSLVTGVLFPVACRWIEQTHAFPVSRIYILEAVGSLVGGLAVTVLLAWHIHTVRVSLLLVSVLVISICVAELPSLIARSHVGWGLTPRVPRASMGQTRGLRTHPTRRRIAFLASVAVAVLSMGAILTGIDGTLVRHMQAAKWGRLLPRDALKGAFHTAQAEYLYGEYGGQWIAMREGGVCEALPNEEQAGQTAATVLCQNPQAKRVLVVGSGLALCSRLLMLPQIEHVAWAHPDAEYARRLLEFIPSRFAVDDGRFHPVREEIRRYLADTRGYFDLVVLSLPDVTSSAFNRYFTLEFYERLKASLRADGVVAVSIAGSEAVWGTELVSLGASARTTLAQVFASQVLVPGEQTWLIASDSKGLTDDPAAARDRFAAIAGSRPVFPAAGLLSVYQPDRAAQAMLAYDKADLPARLLINRDSRPLTYLYGLLLAARQSGASMTRFVKLLALAGWLPFVVPILIFVLLRSSIRPRRISAVSTTGIMGLPPDAQRPSGPRAKHRVGDPLPVARQGQDAPDTHGRDAHATGAPKRERMRLGNPPHGQDARATNPSSFDSTFLVFSTGWVGIAMVIILMYLYETHFGSLYLHLGVISSLFMAGLTVGALFLGRIIVATDRREGSGRHPLHILLIGILVVHGVVLAVLAFWAGGGMMLWRPGQGMFAVAFILSGLCCGGYWPVAAAQLGGAGFNPGEAGSRLETADHLGACLGGLVTSLLMVPVLGTGASLLVLIGLVLANLPATVAALWRGHLALASCGHPARDSSWHRHLADDSRAGSPCHNAGFRYALFGFCACVVICSNILARTNERLRPTLPPYAIAALAGQRQTRHASALLEDSGRKVSYAVVIDADQKPAGYLFSSADFAPEVRGFGGRLNLAIHVDTSGKLVDLLIVRSNETPSYLDLVRGWLESLNGRNLFGPEPFAGVNAVAGATVSSEAILASLQASGQRFAADVLRGSPAVWAATGAAGPEPARSWPAHLPDTTALYLIGTVILAFLAMHRGGTRSRVVILALTFILGGIVLNAQYSSEQIATLLSFNAPAARLTGVFLLVVGVPLLVLSFGNLYCGYLCPFGAAQELLGYVLPRRLRPVPAQREMRAARFVKYAVLVVLVVGFFVAQDRRTLASDPLTSVFALRSVRSGHSPWILGIAAAAIVGSLFYVRFWCRYLCPVGAFLSLLNRARLLRRWVPAKSFGRCEFGLTASDHLDCLYCDRCRHARRSQISNLRSQKVGTQSTAGPLILAAVLLGLFIAAFSLGQLRQALPQILEEPVAAVGAGGRPRNVDARQIRTQIEQGRLSNREAEHYRQVP